jgi:anti-sigma factor RsiW
MTHLDEATLNEYLDGELDPAERAEAERHLGDCTMCQAELAQLARLFTALALAPEPAPGPELAPRLVARFRQETARAQRAPSPLGQWWGVGLVVELLVAAVALIVLWPWLRALLAPVGLPLPALPDLTVLLELPLADWLAATAGRLADLPPLPTFAVIGQWLPIVGLALILWLVGNGLMLRPARQS